MQYGLVVVVGLLFFDFYCTFAMHDELNETSTFDSISDYN